MKHEDSTSLNKWIASQSDTILLSFSTGKDSIAAFIECRRHFKKVVPFYAFLIPNLSFVEKSLAYCEEFFQQKIMRVPHPFLYRTLNALVFQPPQNCSIIEAFDMPTFGYKELYKMIREDAGLKPETWVATGVRSADNPLRRVSVERSGAYNQKLRTFMPIYDWKKDKVISEIQSAGIKLPVDYKVFGRSFDGLDYRFLKPLKDNFPSDYEKVLELFPLADMEFARRDFEHA